MVDDFARHKGRILLTVDLILDKDLHKTSQIEILRHLVARGYDVNLLAMRDKGNCRGDEVNFPIWAVPLRQIPVVRHFFFALILVLLLPIFELWKKPNFVMTGPGALTIAHFVWMPVFSRCLKTKIVMDVRSTPTEIPKGLGGILNVLVFNVSVLLARRAFDGITTVTELMREEICRNFRIDPKFVGVFTEGVSMELFDPAKYVNEATELRKELGLEGKIVVLYHGNFTQHRGIVESVKGLKKVRHEDIVLLLLGNGPALPLIKEAIDRDNISGVIIHEPVKYTDVPKYIAMSDVGLVPLPNIPDWIHQNALNLLECLAMCKPVIVTDIPANRSVLGNSKCAIYISSAHPTEFSNAMVYVRDNFELLKEWGSYGRSLIARKYSWPIIAETLETYLSTL